jgi:HAD superfamily hydrolase (TIGR01509 family)
MNNTGVLTTLLGRSPEPQLLEEVADQKEACFRELIRGHIHPMKGVVTWLSQLQAWGLRQAVASSAPAANIETILGETGIGPYFNAVLTGMDMPAKPDPALFLKAAEAIGSAPERCVVVEDAIAGVQAAKRAGMACIAVLTTNPAGALSQADVIAPNLEALPVETVRQLLHLPPAGK